MKTLMKHVLFSLGLVTALNPVYSQPQNRSWILPNQTNTTMNLLRFNANGVHVSNLTNTNSANPSRSYSAMQDVNGNLLFKVVDGKIYDAHDRFIDGLYDVDLSSQSGNHDFVYGCPEVCIVPVPGNCSRYYIIGIGPTFNWGANNNGSYDLQQPSYVTLDLSLPNLNDNSLRGALVGATSINSGVTRINSGVTYHQHISNMFLAVSKLHGTGVNSTRFLFVSDSEKLYRFTITNSGIGSGTFVGALPSTSHNQSPWNSEMELYEDNATGNYTVAFPNPNYGNGIGGVGIFKLDANGDVITPAASNIFIVNLVSTNGYINGLEFSPSSGRYLYITNTTSPFLQYVDLNATIPVADDLLNANTNIFSTLQFHDQDFKNSQIELGYDGKIYFAASDRMGTLNNPDNILSTTFTNTALDVNGNALPGVHTVVSEYYSDISQFIGIRVLPDQIDGEVYQSNSTLTAQCCVANTGYDVVDYVASSGIWQPGIGNNPFNSSGTISFELKLTVPTNVNLTVRNMTLEFGPEAKVIVEQGGSLTIDHSTFTGSACVSMWKGIEVWGHSNQSQFTAGAQGKLTIKNSATVSNALNAVTLWKPGDWSTTGGIVKASGSHFYNNKRSVEFLSYQNFNPSNSNAPFANLSSFANCDFSIDDQYLGGTTNPFNAHITMWDVWGINFNFCDFENNQTNVTDAQLLGKGISAADGGFSVTGCDCRVINDPGSPCPEGHQTGSKFKGLWIGINAYSVSANRPFSVICADFENNIFGVSAYSLSNILLTNNRFAIGANTAPWPQKHYGLNLQTCTGFTVEENNFSGSQNSATVGAYIYNSGGHANRIYKNKFNKLTYANIAEGINRDNNSGANGLQYLCNLHTDNGQDIYVKPDEYNPGHAANGIAQSLGNTLVVPALSAGNTFTQLASGTTQHFKNETQWIVNYFYTTGGNREPMYFTPNYVNLYLTTNANTCPINFGYGTGTQLTASQKQTLETQYDVNELAFQNLLYNYNQLVDGGNTSSLLTEIQSSWSLDAWELRNTLIGISPFVTEEVIRQSILKNILPQAMVLEICLANVDATRNEKFIDFLRYEIPNPLPVYMIQIIMASWVEKTTRTVLEGSLAQCKSNMASASDLLLTDLYLDTNGISHNSDIMNWLNRLQTITAKYALAEYYFQLDLKLLSSTMLDSMTLIYDLTQEEIQVLKRCKVYLDYRDAIRSSGRNLMQLTAAEVQSLKSFAEGGNDLPGMMAQNLLCFGYGICAVHYANSGGSFMRMAATKSFGQAMLDINKLEVLPNPASTFATFSYRFPLLKGKAIVYISDITGKIVDRISISNTEGQLIWDTRIIENGIYLYQVKDDKTILANGKIVIEQ